MRCGSLWFTPWGAFTAKTNATTTENIVLDQSKEVATMCESESKRYWITDGTKFIYKNGAGKYVIAPGEQMADTFTKKRAQNLFGSMKGSLPTGFRVEAVTNQNIVRKIVKAEDVRFKAVAPDISSIVEIATKFSEVRENAQSRHEVLSEKLSVVDKKINEVLHAIEFGYNYNAPGGYKVYKILRDLRRERRAIKDELYVLSAITGENSGPDDWKLIANMAAGLEKRKYEFKYFDNVRLKMKEDIDEKG